MSSGSDLPKRRGIRPETTPWAPHIQTSQTAPQVFTEALASRVFSLPEVEERPGRVADRASARFGFGTASQPGQRIRFLGLREIGHFHPWDDSLPIALPPDLVEPAVQAGWAEVHPVARAGMAPGNMVMLFGPRDDSEADVLFGLIAAAVRRASGPADRQV